MNSLNNPFFESNENINYNSYSNINHFENESFHVNLLGNENQDFNDNNNYLSINNQNWNEDANDNMEENGAAPLISNNYEEEFHLNDFSFLNASNLLGVEIDSKDILFNNSNNNIILENEENEHNNIEIKNIEKKEPNFQKGDYISSTPIGDNDIIDNSDNNSNSKLINSQDNNGMNLLENNNLSNSSSSQSTNKSSVLNVSKSNNQLNNSSLETLTPPKQSEEKIDFTPKKGKRKRSKSKTKTPKTKNRLKFKPEGIRKKIKSRLHKKLKTIYNEKLKKSNSLMFFDFLPQSFITDVSINNNKAYLKLTMRNLLTKIFGTRAKDKEKLSINKKVLQYLDSNPDIKIESGVDKFLDSTYKDIIQEYIDGNLFEEDLNKLREEKESEDYIEKYNYIAKHLIEFYEGDGKIKKRLKS